MDFIGIDTKNIRHMGGSFVISIPPAVMRNMGFPKQVKVEIGTDKTARLVPIYSTLLYIAFINLIVASSTVAVAFS